MDYSVDRKGWKGNVQIGYNGAEELVGRFFQEPHYIESNPYQVLLEKKVGELYGKPTLLTVRGLAAIQAVVFALMNVDSVAYFKDIYPGTSQMFQEWQRNGHCNTFEMSKLSLEALESVKPGIIFVETIGNAKEMPVANIVKLQEIAEKLGATLVVDSTFTPSYKPGEAFFRNGHILLGSMTKWEQAGDSLSGGRITANAECIDCIRKSYHYQVLLMPLAVAKAYMAIDNIFETINRFQEASDSALCMAEVLERSDLVKKVWYPGLESHPGFERAKRQFMGGGGVFYAQFIHSDVLRRFCKIALTYPSEYVLGPSFGAEKTRLFPFYGDFAKYMGEQGCVRIAAGQTHHALARATMILLLGSIKS